MLDRRPRSVEWRFSDAQGVPAELAANSEVRRSGLRFGGGAISVEGTVLPAMMSSTARPASMGVIVGRRAGRDQPATGVCGARRGWGSGCGGSGGPLLGRSLGGVTMKFPDSSYALIRNTST